MPPNIYFSYFRNIKSSTLDAIIDAEDRGLWTVSDSRAFESLGIMYEDMADNYDMEAPDLISGHREVYHPWDNVVELSERSITSALHEFRHAMQNFGFQHYNDMEEDARGWSISAFRYALPEDFEEAWRNDNIWFLGPYDEDALD